MKVTDLEIKSPCCESWDEMRGTASRRFCDLCEKDVYNLSALSKEEVRQLFASKRRPCIRYTYDESESIVFTHPQVRRQQRGMQRLLRAAAVALPLVLMAPMAVAHAQDNDSPAQESLVGESDEQDVIEPIWEQGGFAVLMSDSDESSDSDSDGDDEDDADSADDADNSDNAETRWPPRPPKDTNRVTMGVPPRKTSLDDILEDL